MGVAAGELSAKVHGVDCLAIEVNSARTIKVAKCGTARRLGSGFCPKG